MFKRLLIGLGAVAALSACTPEEHAVWLDWNAQDPAAAMEFADSYAHAERGSRYQATASDTDPVWDRLANCESNGNWHINTGNGYYGGLQFALSTWRANGGSGYPHNASREEQIRVAEVLRSQAGFSPWPGCRRKLGL
jgi:Transglycosylase-like domain